MNTIQARRNLDFSGRLAERGWYHSFELPDGTTIAGVMDLDHQRRRYGSFPVPEDLRGKRVLDIGAWDGWFSFESERRGAAVVAVDCVEVPNFLKVHRLLNSKVDYRVLDFYELPQAALGAFEIVLFLGVLYHLKHPLLALEIVCELTADVAIVESFVTNGDTWKEAAAGIPAMEFYETNELGNQLDNWIGPTVECLLAMCRAAGFARVELLHAEANNASVACYRRWTPEQPASECPELLSVMNSRSRGINFSKGKDEYIACWFRANRENITREQLQLEVDGYGVGALHVREDAGAWLANFRVPPGLGSGWKPLRLRFADSAYSRELRIAFDIPLEAGELILKSVHHGRTWEEGRISADAPSYVTCWVKGLPEIADRANVRIELATIRLLVEYIGAPDPDGYRQINATATDALPVGIQTVRVLCGSSSIATQVQVL